MLRLLAIVVVALAVAPATASAATVTFDAGSGVIRIGEDVPTAEDIAVEQTSTLHIVTIAPPGQLNAADPCTGGPTQVTCPKGTSIAVDLGDGDDRFRTIDNT